MRMAYDLDVNSDLTHFLVRNIDDEIEIVVEKKVYQSEKEGKCLKEMPMFTIREIENHRFKSEKSSSAIMKTTNRGKRFKEERYLSADDFFVANTERIFYVKGKCKASMKREIRSMEVGINKVNSDIIFVKCSCLTGESRCLNHVMALLFEIADYSLRQLISIPEKKHVLAWPEGGVYHQQIHLQNNQSRAQL